MLHGEPVWIVIPDEIVSLLPQLKTLGHFLMGGVVFAVSRNVGKEPAFYMCVSVSEWISLRGCRQCR